MDLLSLALVVRRGDSRAGQILAETALVLPMLLFLSGCTIQLGFLGYASCLARYAAFAGLRAAAVAPEKRSGVEAEAVVRNLTARAPFVRLQGVRLIEIEAGRACMSVRIGTPSLVPFLPREINAVEGRSAMMLEPEW